MSDDILALWGTLSVGSTLKEGRLFGGLPVIATWVVEHVNSKGVITFAISMRGVHLVRVAGKPQDDGRIAWVTLKDGETKKTPEKEGLDASRADAERIAFGKGPKDVESHVHEFEKEAHRALIQLTRLRGRASSRDVAKKIDALPRETTTALKRLKSAGRATYDGKFWIAVEDYR